MKQISMLKFLVMKKYDHGSLKQARYVMQVSCGVLEMPAFKRESTVDSLS